MDAVESLESQNIACVHACQALCVSRATYYRYRKAGRTFGPHKPRPTPTRALSQPERQEILDILYSKHCVDKSPQTVYARLLDRNKYICSIRTMYRILGSQNAVHERRTQRAHPEYKTPQLAATAPNQIWSWDITKLRGA